MLETLKYTVWQANRRMSKLGLAEFCDGAVSAADRDKGLFVIKPCGVEYDELVPESFTVIDWDGNILEGSAPSPDWQTHLALYKTFPDIGAIAHTAGEHTAGFGAARRPIPVFSELHAKHFAGDIPATRLLTKEEIENDYELNVAKTIGEAFKERDAVDTPAVIVSGGTAYAWAKTAVDAVQNAAYLERAAKLTLTALTLSEGIPPLSAPLQKKLKKKS